jgi:hypothetical protein
MPRKEVFGCQPVSRRSLPLSPTSRTGFFFSKFESVTAHSRQSTPAISHAICKKSLTVCGSPVATTKSSGVAWPRIRIMASA